MLTLQFTEAEQKELHYQRFHHPHPRVQKKMEAVYLKSLDQTVEQISVNVRVCVRTVRRYLKTYPQGGIEALKEFNVGGKTSELDQHQDTLQEYFAHNPPHTVKQVKDDITRLTGIERSETQVRQFLKRLGLKRLSVMMVPKYALEEEKQHEQRNYHDNELQPRLQEARQGQRKVYFVDAAHFVFGGFVGFLWCLMRVLLPTPSGRKRFNVLGALDFVSKTMLSVSNLTYINSLSVCDLLRLLAEENPGIPITLFLDNASYQRCTLVKNLAKELGIELMFLPSYSPNLNLIERVWKFVKKKCLRAKHYHTFEEFQQAICNCLEQLDAEDKDDMQTLITPKFQLFDKGTVSPA